MSYPHLEHLKKLLPDLLNGRLLDLGSGKGKLLLAVAEAGGSIVGLEYNPVYIIEAQRRLVEQGLQVEIIQGRAEQLPFVDNSFDFINMSELIEHVQEPEAVLREAYRVLRPGGSIYVSVPNRFGAYDPHFHLWFLNWLPRFMVNTVLALIGKHKDYSSEAGHQRLTEMHYYTFGAFKTVVEAQGFQARDIRLGKISVFFPQPLLRFCGRVVYYLLRFAYFNTFHLLLTKPVSHERR
jgi:ubiquinone/menaquinone biosynthesis C-methylase UbiE